MERLLVECCNRMYQTHEYLGIEPLAHDVSIWASYVDVDEIIDKARSGSS